VSLLPIRTSVPFEAWESGPVTLLGDAVHSMTPFRGIGANTALRDAQLLCRKLIASPDDFGPAVAAYERRMREYGFQAVRASKRSADQFVSDNRVARAMARGNVRAPRRGAAAEAAGVPRARQRLADPFRLDGEQQPHLVATAEPRVGAPEVALGELLDVLLGAVGGDLEDPPADRVNTAKVYPDRRC